MATMRGVFSDRPSNISRFKPRIRGVNHLHETYTLVKDDFTLNEEFQHYKSKADGREYGIRKIIVNGRKPAMKCRELIQQAMLESAMLTENRHVNILQYQAEESWIVVPERTPRKDIVDFCEQGADFLMSARSWSLIGMEVYLVFEADLFQDTLHNILRQATYHGALGSDMEWARIILTQLTLGVHSLEELGYTSSDGFTLKNAFCESSLQLQLTNSPSIALGGFSIKKIELGDPAKNTSDLGYIYMQFIFFTRFANDSNIVLRPVQLKRIHRLVADNALPALRMYINDLLAVDKFIVELIVQCLQAEPARRPDKKVIRKILIDDLDARKACKAAVEFGKKIGYPNHYELVFKSSYEDLFLQPEFLAHYTKEEQLEFKKLMDHEFPLVHAWCFSNYTQQQKIVKHLSLKWM